MFAAAEEPARSKSKWPKLLALVAVLLVCAAGGTFVMFPGLFSKRAAPAAENTALALRVEHNAGQLVLTWNRDTELIKTATKGMLSISDGDRRENVDIDLAQLKNGSIVYSPFTNDVSFRLEVTAPGKGNVSEYVRVLGTRPSALDPTTPEQAKAGQPSQPPQPTAAADGTDPNGAAENTEPEQPAQPSAPRRQFQMESLAQRLRPAKPSELEAPPELGQAGTVPGGLRGIPQPNLPPPPVQAAQPPKPAPSAAQQGYRVGGQVREAKLVSSRRPTYPPLARQARVRGVVEIEATVGKDGRVKNVRVINGHPLLTKAAADAVKEWIYTPSMLNGEAVEATTRVTVGFDLGN